jgi:hypothetical protein
MNRISKSLLQKHQARPVLRHPMHILVPTQSWDESYTSNGNDMKVTRQIHHFIALKGKKKSHDESTIVSTCRSTIIRSTPQRCLSWNDSNLFYSSSFSSFTRRNFSSFGKTTVLGEKISSSNNGVTQPSKDKDSSSSTDSSASSDSTDSTVTKKERLQNAAQRGKKAVSKGAVSLRGLIQKYGWTFVGTYLGVYFVTLGTLFISVDSGLIDPVTITSIEWPWHPSGVEDATTAGGGGGGGDASNTSSSDQKDFDSAVEFVASYMKKFPWTAPYSDFVLRNPHLANLGIAWVATKLTEPIRLPVSIAIVRKIKQDRDDA